MKMLIAPFLQTYRWSLGLHFDIIFSQSGGHNSGYWQSQVLVSILLKIMCKMPVKHFAADKLSSTLWQYYCRNQVLPLQYPENGL